MADRRHLASTPNGQHLARTPDERDLARTPDERDLARTPDEREARFGRVECDHCGVAVLVAKFSLQHTSVQWSAASVRACAEFSARVAAGEQTALIDTCARLRGSIDRAAAQGRLEVSPP